MLSHDIFIEPFHRFFPKPVQEPEKKAAKRNLIVDMFFSPLPHQINRTFKAYVFGEGNFKAWAGASKKMDDFNHNLQISANKITDSHTLENAFCEIFPKTGFSLTAPVEKIVLEGKSVYSADKGALLISLDRQLSNEVLNAMIEQAPDMILCLD